ncbi:MAG: sugar ABC transporter permease [Defluviitaleaceae bacterium]|nr:sugar ABC transporter permease [Defluviitaleaceae bacterium]
MVKTAKVKGKKRIKLAPYMLLIPWFIGMALFRVYPIIASFINSLYQFQPIRGTREFIGFDNYTRILFDFPHFWDSVRATLTYVLLGTPLVLIMAFFVAFILNFKLKGVNLFRTAYYIPSILGGNVAVAIVWSQVFGGNGPVNAVLSIFGVDPISWIQDEFFAPFTLIFLSAWQFGSVMLIFLAALQNVSPTLYEAASIDGAKKTRQLFSITLPLVTPVLLFNTVNVLLRHFQEFNSAYLITMRGPNRATDFLVILIYEYAFRRMQFGFALAMSMMLLLIIGILTLIVFITSKYWVHYSD